MLRKHYRVVIDVDVDIEEITPEFAHNPGKRPRHAGEIEEHDRREEERHNAALLEAFRADEAKFDEFLKMWILNDLSEGMYDQLNFELDDNRYLLPVIDRLEPPSRQFFLKALGDQAFIDRTERFYDAIKREVAGVSIFEKPDGATRR